MVNIDCAYMLLAEAIIQTAASDYFEILVNIRDETEQCNQAELEEFFRSTYFAYMTKIDPELLMEGIKKRAAEFEMRYSVTHIKGTRLWYVCRAGDRGRRPVSPFYTGKKQALEKAAEMEGLTYQKYMLLRGRGMCDDV